MPKVYTLTVDLETKDLLQALTELAKALQGVETTAATRVHVHSNTSHRDAIQLLADLLPAESRGFKAALHQRNWSAAEVRAELGKTDDVRADWFYSGDVVPLVDYAGFLKLFAAWQAMRPDCLRRTSLGIRIRGVRWPGASDQVDGKIELRDAKAFPGKKRFDLVFVLEEKTDRSEEETVAEFAAIARETGLDFTQARVFVRPDPEAKPWEQLPAACLLFSHCVELVSDELLAAGFDWKTLPCVYADHQGVEHRFAQYGRSAARNFRWESQVNQFIRAAFPKFKKTKELDDGYFYASKLVEGWEILVHFDTHPGHRIGRVFKLRCGVRSSDPSRPKFRRLAPVLRCAGGGYYGHWDSCPEFAFDTAEELEQTLAALGLFMRGFLDRFTSRLQQIFLPGLAGDWTTLMPVIGRLTVREALVVARRELSKRGLGELPLCGARLTGIPGGLHYRDDPVGQPAPDGKTTVFHAWCLSFCSGQRFLTMEIPYAGLPVLAWQRIMAGQQMGLLIPLADTGWIDSPEVAQAMAAALARFQSRYPAMNALMGLPALLYEDGGLLWRCQMEFSGEAGPGQGWVRIEHSVDAHTGASVKSLIDERFPDRAEPHIVTTEPA